MNKKLLPLASLIIGLGCMPCFAFDDFDAPPPPPPAQNGNMDFNMRKPHMNSEAFAKKKAEFEARLNLTEEQKIKSKEIREKGRKEMEPLMEAIKTKRQELKKIGESRIAVQDQQERTAAVKKEIGELNKKLHEQRMKNMKEFESILTDKQLKELKKMKEEGRKQFEKAMKDKCNCKQKDCKCDKQMMRPPFQGGARPFGPEFKKQ